MWREDFSYLLSVVKDFIVELWELRKLNLYSNNTCPIPPALTPRGGIWVMEVLNGKNGGSGN